jgi:hypothetical protein
MTRYLVLALGLAGTLAACGSPAPAPPAPKAATPATGTPAVLDPKGTIDTARAAAGAATAAQGARTGAEAPKAGSPAPLVASKESVTATAAPALAAGGGPNYSAQGRRDPFESQESRLGSDRSTIATAKLTGLIQSGTGALALVETADGIGYILKTGDTLADGRLVEIGFNTAVFSLAPKPGATTNRVVLKLTGD